MQQATDFLEDSRQLYELLADTDKEQFNLVTLFRNWTINDVIGHLYLFNVAAALTLSDETGYAGLVRIVEDGLARGEPLVEIQKPWLGTLSGRDLLKSWWDQSLALADLYRDADPARRVKWIGPGMSARSCITARQMEVWAHGQEVFDILGEDRQCFDRIRNIVHLGVLTCNWTFNNRGLFPPDPAPHVSLVSPGGHVWTWNEEQASNCVKGAAVEFAQVVTQVRNIDDTGLVCEGNAARQWMELAQCFAGPPSDPPAKGTRYKSPKN